MNKYSSKQGLLPKSKVQLYGKELERILAERGRLTPEIVLEESQSPRAVLHNVFNWDDKEAAHKFRIQQAMWLLRVITLNIEGKEGVRAFVNLDVGEADEWQEGSQYIPLGTVLQNPSLRSMMLREAVNEMTFFRRKYEQLKELAAVHQAIDKTKAKIK